MKKVILLLIIVLSLFVGGYLFYAFKINSLEKEYHKNLSPKDLNPESFITLFKEKYNKKSQLNFVTLLGEFPENWVKQKDIPYLISIMNSKEKCCGYMNFFSSTISNEDAEVGGFAIIFLNSYISKTKINLGLNSNPKTDKESINKIEDWYQKYQN
ncbi:hypothetical protein GCM10022422_39730 [Flavobacterium ginsengisoli]|uniref:DUF4359 domain-containing protein n=1 Tax=Flavobacterium ginsengisoli TaxID=871694 RepID=A0ABP7FZT4_9FLAO|nr:hypothetical protein [Flavobacterium ginsengisoli]